VITFGNQGRYADDAYIISISQINMIVDALCKQSKFVLVCGPRYSGKSLFLNSISTQNYNVSRLNTGEWLKQMSPYENLSSHKLYESLLNVEKTLVEELIEKDAYNLFKEIRGIEPESRRIALQRKEDIIALMFDAPMDMLAYRCNKADHHLTLAAKLTQIDREQEMFKWPTKSEGFKKVYYIGVSDSEQSKQMMHDHFTKVIAI
jgi:predicted kinase